MTNRDSEQSEACSRATTDGDLAEWFLIELGCAECGDTPLAMPRGMYPSEQEARAAAAIDERWIAHPNGGSFVQWGSGGFWCAPINALSVTDGEFGDKYDEAFRIPPRVDQ